MKRIFPLCLLAGLAGAAFAQEAPTSLKINPSQDSRMKGYLYPLFQPGRVLFKDGSNGKAALNFNLVDNQMQFISPGGDTLKMAHPETTAMVVVAADTFCYFNNTFARKVTHYGSAPELFQRIDMKHVRDEQKSAYGYSPMVAKTSSGYFANDATTHNLAEDKNMIFRQNEETYIANEKGDLYVVKQSTFSKLYPAWKNDIKAFIEKKELVLTDAADVKKLTDYIHQLQLTRPAAE